MDQEGIAMDLDAVYPILFIPKKCTMLDTNCDITDNVFIDVTITSPDTEGNETCVYSGFCNIKLIDTYDVNILHVTSSSDLSPKPSDELPVVIDDNQAQPTYSQSEVWIDPCRSPYVYNRCDTVEPQEHYSVCNQTNRITVEQHNTYITKNVYNYKEAIHYCPPNEFDHKKFRKYESNQVTSYDDNEFDCGVFLSQLPEEIINQKATKDREERRFIDAHSDNGALKQLMSSDIQSASKQRKTILFLGHDANYGQTVQKIAIVDPAKQCSAQEVDHEVVIEDIDPHPNQKKYQCAKCQQIFEHIADFRDHMVKHKTKYSGHERPGGDVKLMCIECGKNLKTQEKFDLHCLSHGDPELECNKCHKVFASKFTLRAHKKIHTRKHPCRYCTKTYATDKEMRAHVAKIHLMFMCDCCDFIASKFTELSAHKVIHSYYRKDSSDTDFGDSFLDDVMSESDMITPSPDDDWRMEDKTFTSSSEEIQKADSVIAKVMSNKMFLAEKATRNRSSNKACDVCLKTFDRVSDLKRHLIEHVVRSTLAKTPVSASGTLTIQCEICQTETFSKIDRYKAHLREHAKLTLYQCTFCNKSFSDSSNFSKHKKIHGSTYFQCDLCQRKFNSKKMITQHMEYHNQNTPLSCEYCGKIFYFESMRNKHIKSTHTREQSNRFRCKFCHEYFTTLKDKWDHEWVVHSVRKMIADCRICGAKFRKYAELKRHCIDEHNIEIPPAKKLFKKRKY